MSQSQIKPRYSQGSCIFLNRKMLTQIPKLTILQSRFLEELDLSENFLPRIDSISEHRFPALITLNLSLNLIVSIDPLANAEMPNLSKLYLHGNQITSIQPLRRCRFKQLIQLRIGYTYRGNSLERIDQLAKCEDFGNLQELALDCNQIQQIRPLREMKFQNLVILFISNNNIETVDDRMFNVFPSLKVLSLRENKLTSVRFLSKLIVSLEYVALGENQIVDISRIYENCFSKLTRIVLEKNKIGEIWTVFKCNWKLASQVSIFQMQLIYQPSKLNMLFKKFMQAANQ